MEKTLLEVGCGFALWGFDWFGGLISGGGWACHAARFWDV